MPGKAMLTLVTMTMLVLPAVALERPAYALAGGNIAEQLDRVDGQRILDSVSDLQDFGSRAFYLNSSKEAGAYIFQRFQGLSLPVHYQNFSASGYETGNIIATLAGESPDEPGYLFGAHYDSFNEASLNYSIGANTSAPGADDDASGVAAVLELATVLSTLKLERTVTFVAFGAEELNADQTGGGLAGSTAYVTHEKGVGTEFAGTAILDMIGYRLASQNRCTLIAEDGHDAFTNATREAVSEFGLDIQLTTIVNPWVSFSDHWPFWQAGYPSVLAIEELDPSTYYPANPFYHTAEDKAYHLSESQMSSMSKALLGALLTLDAAKENGGSGNLVFLVLLIVAIAVAVAVIIALRVRRERRI